MRIAVMGAGGTGGYFGGLLARAGEDVTFIARGAHLAALQTQGLHIQSRLAGDFTVTVHATDNPHTMDTVELVLFCVKTYDTLEAAHLIRPLVAPDTIVLPLQNGIDVLERLAPVVGRSHVIGGVAFITSSVTAPGTVTQTGGAGKIIIGEPAGGASERTDALLQTFQRAGIPAQIHEAVEIALWQKFVFICAFGGVTALTRLPIGPILESPECRALFEGVMKEVTSVARARHIELPADAVQQGLALAMSFEPWARGSLYHDLASGRRLELDVLNGMVVRAAAELGLSVPLNFAVNAALQPYARGTPAQAMGEAQRA